MLQRTPTSYVLRGVNTGKAYHDAENALLLFDDKTTAAEVAEEIKPRVWREWWDIKPVEAGDVN